MIGVVGTLTIVIAVFGVWFVFALQAHTAEIQRSLRETQRSVELLESELAAMRKRLPPSGA